MSLWIPHLYNQQEIQGQLKRRQRKGSFLFQGRGPEHQSKCIFKGQTGAMNKKETNNRLEMSSTRIIFIKKIMMTMVAMIKKTLDGENDKDPNQIFDLFHRKD